jgi:Flp pilus assembly protein TadD
LNNPGLQRFIAREMLFINHYKNQITDLEARLQQNQQNVEEFAREYFLMANECEVKFKDDRSAIANLNKALQLNPLFVDALLRRATLLRKTGDTAGAEKDCNTLLKIKQRHFKALLLRGKIRLQLNNLESAYQDLLEAMHLRKSNPEVYKILSKICAKMGETEKAKNYKNIGKALEENEEEY